ncbi:MAG: hypothetical protein AB7S26_09020 [Sandaracinaceae bacterium]
MHRSSLTKSNPVALGSAAYAMRSLAIAAWALGAIACVGSPVGDPCVPESIPAGGFDPQEVYLETSSVQCRTRVCMVYQLQGNPESICEDNGGAPGCIMRQTVNNQVFCSCRCSAESGQSNVPLCDCGDGFRCLEEGERGFVTSGGLGVRGGYCVPCIKPDGETRGLDPLIFEACPQG